MRISPSPTDMRRFPRNRGRNRRTRPFQTNPGLRRNRPTNVRPEHLVDSSRFTLVNLRLPRITRRIRQIRNRKIVLRKNKKSHRRRNRLVRIFNRNFVERQRHCMFISDHHDRHWQFAIHLVSNIFRVITPLHEFSAGHAKISRSVSVSNYKRPRGTTQRDHHRQPPLHFSQTTSRL